MTRMDRNSAVALMEECIIDAERTLVKGTSTLKHPVAMAIIATKLFEARTAKITEEKH